MYPMSRGDFDYWVGVLRENFPDYPMLKDLHTTWYPAGETNGPFTRLGRWWREFVRRDRRTLRRG